MAKLSFDIESSDSSVIRVLDDINRTWFWHDTGYQDRSDVKCLSLSCKSKNRTNAILMPTRKMVKWRGKKMLVSKTKQRVVQFDATKIMERLRKVECAG